MDDVPVKIAEKYKPPPLVYQLPQSIVNKLAQETNYYNENEQFNYDFQLERNVIGRVQCWRKMREQEREARLERMERRKQERLRSIEAHQKEMLGAVNYPSAEELSSSSEDETANVDKNVNQEDEMHDMKATTVVIQNMEKGNSKVTTTTMTNTSSHSSSFHNILQPTILTTTSKLAGDCMPQPILQANHLVKHHSNASFNYSDFEFDNSSPFDNIELKTINDLDMLAQVLHDTQMKTVSTETPTQSTSSTINDQTKALEVQQLQSLNVEQEDSAKECSDDSKCDVRPEINLTALEETKAALEKVDFNNYNQTEIVENIPNTTVSNDEQTHQTTTQQLSNNYNFYNMYSTQQQQHQLNNYVQHHAAANYNQYYNQTKQSEIVAFNNHNYLLTSMPQYCNGTLTPADSNEYTPAAIAITSSHLQPQQHHLQLSKMTNNRLTAIEDIEQRIKSKSVPNILNEDLVNSQMRRSRNLSHNSDNNDVVSHPLAATTTKTTRAIPKYDELAASAQKLAKRISSMGFPLERVSNVIRIYGVDDKKIIEHLIPLCELLDLGFDETKISAALLKFDNNKDKALDFLIS